MFAGKVLKWGSVSLTSSIAAHLFAHAFVTFQSDCVRAANSVASAAVEVVAENAGYVRAVPQMPAGDALAMVTAECVRQHVNPSWCRALLNTESARDQFALSGKGAIGYMQIMPANAKRCGLKKWQELFDDVKNIRCGVQIGKEEQDTYLYRDQNGLAVGPDLIKATRAYNGGPRCVNGGCPESEDHLRKVLARMASDVKQLS